MFLNYNSNLFWSSNFYVNFFEGSAYFISEAKHFSGLESKYSTARSCIESGMSINEFSESLESSDKILFFQSIDELYNEGVVSQKPSSIASLDNNKFISYHFEGGDVYDFCGAMTIESNYKIFLDLVNIYKTDVLLVNDYLSYYDSLNLEGGRDYLLVSISSNEKYLGPLFSRFDVCFKCLKKSVIRNQPLRDWLGKKINSVISLPIDIRPLSEQEKTNIFPAVERLMKSRDVKEILSFSNNIESNYWHEFGGCDCSPTSDSGVNLSLKSSLKSPRQEGGFRTLPSSETLKNVQKVLGKLTGLVSHSEELSFSNLPYKTYKSSFFRAVPINSFPQSYGIEITSLGKGASDTQAEVSSICESLERYAAYYQGYEPYTRAAYNELMNEAISPNLLIGLSDHQKKNYEDMDYPAKQTSHGAALYRPDREISWYPAWSLVHDKTIYIPTCYAFANAEPELKYCSWNSNGCAAGNTLEEAILQGFLEVVERDAIAIWWYNKLQLSMVSLDFLPERKLLDIENTLGIDWEYWVLDATNDFNIPVFASVAINKDSGRVVFGFGCHLSPSLAVERALTELCQIISVADNNIAPFDFDNVEMERYLYPNTSKPKDVKKDYPVVDNRDILDDVRYCKSITSKLDLDFIVVNYNRAELPINTVKVIIPGAVHIWPQFSLDRLYDVPVKMGNLDRRLDESSLNNNMLYV